MPGTDAAPSPLPHPQLSTSRPHDPPLYPAALPWSRTCCFFPQHCQHIPSGTCSGCGSGLSLGPISHPQLTLQPSERSRHQLSVHHLDTSQACALPAHRLGEDGATLTRLSRPSVPTESWGQFQGCLGRS